jgi:CheY-like chemotaxis protein
MSIPPIFFPTRVLLIDDEPQVLRMTARLFRQRPEVADVITFADAPSALAFIDEQRARLPALDAFAAARVRDEFDDDGPLPVVRRQVEIELAAVTGVLDAPARHELISVIVCDYAMPVMDGLEFFGRSAEPNTRRVLLTALCDEHRAVQAFNRGAIHHFVHKADAAGPRGLEAMLGEQARAFFRAHTSHLAAALALGPAGRLLVHPALPRLLQDVMQAGGHREYSFSAAPLGFRLGGGARPASLVLADAGTYARTLRVVGEVEAPQALATALRARTILPVGRDGAPIYDAGDAWAAHAIVPQVADGAEPLHWAVIERG